MAKIRKKIAEFLRDWFGVAAIRICYLLIPLFPLKISYAIARILAKSSFSLLKKQRNTILGNLDVAFGDQMNKEEKRKIAREMVINVFKGFFEGFYIASRFRKKVVGIATI